MAVVDGTQFVDGHVRQAAIVLPFDADWATGLADGLEELRRFQVNIGLCHQDRFVLHADNQITVLLEGLPEGVSSLQGAIRNIDLEGF